MSNSGESIDDNLFLIYTVSCIGAGFGIGVGSYGVMFSLLTKEYSLVAIFLLLGAVSLILGMYIYSEVSSLVGSDNENKHDDQPELGSGREIPAIPSDGSDSSGEEQRDNLDMSEVKDSEDVDEVINADGF